MIQLNQELETWFSSLSHHIRYRPEDSSDDSVIKFHKALLYVIYLALKRFSYRSMSFTSASESITLGEFRNWSLQKARDAASKITSTNRSLFNAGLMKYSPSVAVNLLLEAVTTYLLEVRSFDTSFTEESAQKFSSCLQGLQSLSDV